MTRVQWAVLLRKKQYGLSDLMKILNETVKRVANSFLEHSILITGLLPINERSVITF